MPKMIVKTRDLRKYGRETLDIGSEFEATEKDARFFRKSKWAEDAPAPPIVRAPAAVRTRPAAIVAAAAAQASGGAEPAAPAEVMTTQNTYARRDMKAEGE